MKSILSFFIVALALCAHAQVTTTITTGPNWKDALLMSSLRPVESHMATTNYGTYPRLAAIKWTHASYQISYRSLLRFDLSAFAPGTVIQSATLYFYSDPANPTGELSNQILSSASNSMYLQKVTQSWNDATVTWNTQPTTTATNRVWVGPSTSATENIQVNITAFVQDMVNNPASNFGIMMQLENEVHHRSRNYASTNHTNSALHPKLVITVAPPADPVKAVMDHTFALLDQSKINTGVLTDYGIDLASHEIYNGTMTDENIMSMDKWRLLYGSLLSSVTNPSSNLIHLKTINQTLEDLWAGYDQSNPIVDIAAQFVRYQTLKEDALTQGMVSITSDQRLYDTPGNTVSPYLTNYAFAAAPHVGVDTDGDVTFMLRSSLLVNSSDKTMSTFAVDYDDGNGFQIMTVNTPKAISYITAGKKHLQFKFTCTDGSTFYSHANFEVLKEQTSGAAQARYEEDEAQAYRFPRAGDGLCPEVGFPNPEIYQGASAKGLITCHYGDLGNRVAIGCNPQFIRPLIVVEGYDPSKFSSFGLPNWNFELLLNARGNGGLRALVNGADRLSDRLDVAGYDLIFVDFGDGTGDIVRNAYLLENVIRWVNVHKINNPVTGQREKNVVLGQSMGGLVARYAVCDMEKRRIASTTNPDHEVRLLVTQDTPHRGANVPLGFQALINNLAGQSLTKIGLASFGSTGAIVGSFLEMQDVVPQLKQGKQLLNEPASRQMLIVQDGQTNTFLDGAYRDMVTLANPTFMMRAIANGSECGQGQLLEPGGELFYANASFFANELLFPIASQIVSGPGGTAYQEISGSGLGTIARVGLNVLHGFAGKKWKTVISIKAAPASGTAQVFSAKMTIEKKILWLVPITLTVHNSTKNSSSGTLGWDAYPGGYYDLHQFQTRIPSNPNVNAYPIIEANLTVRLAQSFNFVPTVSALDITTSPLTAAAATAQYTNGTGGTYSSRFENFITQERDVNEEIGSFFNTEHLQFTSRSASWLLNLMAGTDAVASCSFTCPTGSTAASIVGLSQWCVGSEVYSLSQVPTGTAHTWEVTGPFTTSSLTAPTLTVTAVSYQGNGTVRANLNSAACGRLTLTKNIIRGNLPWPVMSYENGRAEYFTPGLEQQFYVGQTVSFLTMSYPSATAPITWIANNATVSWSSGTSAQIYFPQAGDVYINVQTTAPCGTAGAGNLYRVIGSSLSGIAAGGYSYHPNPVNETLTISSPAVAEATNKNAAVTENRQTTYQVRLVDSTGNEVLLAAGVEAMSLDTRSLPNGLYYMTVTNEKGSYSETIIIEH